MVKLSDADGKIHKNGQSGYENGYFENVKPQTPALQGIPAFKRKKYGLKAARRAPQFSKR